MIAFFLISWIFFFLKYTFCDPEFHICPRIIAENVYIEDILFWIGYSNSMINPFLYNFTNHDFRKAFKDLLKLGSKRTLNHKKNSLNSRDDFRRKSLSSRYTILEYLSECVCFRRFSNSSSSRSDSLTPQYSARKHTSITEEETRRLS